MNLSESQSTRLDVHAYVRECDLYIRRVMAFAGLSILTVIVCFAVVLPFRDQIRDSLADRFGMPAAELAIGLTPTPALLVMFVGILWLQRMANRTPELNCPMCKKSIVGMKHLLVAAKCCPHCGARILNDVE